MPIKTSSGKWKWGNVERSSKKELVQTVYGIWKKNGSKGSFSDFLKGTHESIEEQKEKYFVTDLDYSKHIKPILDVFKSWPHVNVENITKHDKDVKLKWFGLYTGHKLEDIVALVAIQTNFDDYTINIANVCSNGHGNGKKLLDKIIDYYSKTDRKYLVWFADPNGGEKLKNYYRTNFPDAKETEEKNEWWQTSKFTLKLKESVEPKDAKTYAYHCTDVDPEIIKKEGWKVGDGFTLDNQFKDLYKKYLPNVPVFVSRLDVPIWDYKSKYCIKLDITGLKLFPDFGYLPDFGAYYDYDEECFYWENEDDLDSNKKLKDFVLDNCDNLTLYADCFDGDDSFNVLGTACVDGSKLKDRIVEYVSTQTGKRVKSESYEPPYSLDTIKQKYGDEVYRKLRDDPVHRFRAETGIEVIHKEPTKDEFERIVKNWDLMTPEQKKQSDEFSIKTFGNNNKNRIDLLRKEYDFEVGDKVKIRSGIRCRQSGHTGTIVRIDPPGTYDYDMHGWSSFIVKMDDPNLGTVGFQSGSIEKLDTVKEYWAKNGRYFYCYDCDKNMTKAPDDQYVMIDDDLWEYVCKHGGKKIGTEEDLCRDCIEKRLGRPLTLKDLGDKINLPINDEIKKMLKKRRNKMTNEAHEIHSYPEKLQPTLERIVKNNEDYELDHAYFNKEGKFIWMRNSKGYFHVFKPVKFVKTPGMTKPFGFKDLILKDNGMLEEVDSLRFYDGNEGLKYLKDKYRLDLNTIR